MNHVKQVEKELSHALRFVEPLLRLLGVWPLPDNAPLRHKILQRVDVVFLCALQVIVLVPSFYYVLFKEEDVKKQFKMMIPLISSISQILKYIILLYRSREFKMVLEKIREDWMTSTEENRRIFANEIRKGHLITVAMIIGLYTSGLTFRVAFPLSKGRILLPNNRTIRILPSPGYYTFNEQLTPNYEILFTLQVLQGFAIYTMACGSIGIIIILCLHVSGLLRILINKLIDFTIEEQTDEDVVQRKLVNIVELQMKIKGFLSIVESITEYVCFFEICINTLLWCIIVYNIFTELSNNNYAPLLVYFTMSIICTLSTYAVCYIGQLLLDESNAVQRTCVTLSWYHLPKRKVRSVLMIIIRSNQSIKLTGGKVIDMSLATFSDIMKTTFGYFNMMRNFF